MRSSSTMAKTKAGSNPSGRAASRQSHPQSESNGVDHQSLVTNDSAAASAQNGAATNGTTHLQNGADSGASKTVLTPELSEKVKELVRPAQEQGYLTYGDINENLPDNVATPEQIEEELRQLRN